MHILDDLSGLSSRAKSLLERTGRRDDPQEPRLSTEFLRIRDCYDRWIPAPMMLVIRREGFAQRYGGLRYRVRSSCPVEDKRQEVLRDWHYDLGQGMWTGPAHGWYFAWLGERVSSPVRYLVHTDGRVGVDDGGGRFLEIAPSIGALIESHALTDMLATWDRTTAAVDGFALAQQLGGLTDIPEASGRTIRWRLSDNVAVEEFRNWSSDTPRRWRAFVWSRGESGRRQVEAAAARVATTQQSVAAGAENELGLAVKPPCRSERRIPRLE
ncbi:hypothetical protein SAMN05216223_12384 [Actinacidiphila yanglinensis]|uniref:Uncharacterized protein n=1 Tax=Actinacidiphila yanglinensis TaxID=310779 RepID=A0A1H6E132_9ACTN|nr:hypothetical protein [Actinacidiphila yanglinensis]SEG91328.1 hypothetical protein SAMN05216223_12384 [Actinacidiphila yanglinensis]